MFKKSTISNLERNLLFCLTSVIPIIVFSLIFFIILIIAVKEGILALPQPLHPAGEASTTPAFALFRLSVVLILSISSILIILKKVSHSFFLYLIPILFFINSIFDLYKSLHAMIEFNAKLGYNDFAGKSFTEVILSYINGVDLFLLGFIILIILWHTKILIQDKVREKVSLLP